MGDDIVRSFFLRHKAKIDSELEREVMTGASGKYEFVAIRYSMLALILDVHFLCGPSSFHRVLRR